MAPGGVGVEDAVRVIAEDELITSPQSSSLSLFLYFFFMVNGVFLNRSWNSFILFLLLFLFLSLLNVFS